MDASAYAFVHGIREGCSEEPHAGRQADNTRGRGRALEAVPYEIAKLRDDAEILQRGHHTRPATDPVVGHVGVEVGFADQHSPVDPVGRQRVGGVAVDAYYPGELHAFHALVMRASAQRCWRDTFDFLDKYVTTSC